MRLVTVRSISAKDSVGTSIITVNLDGDYLASDPIPYTESGQKPDYESTPYLNLDDFLGTTGSGEHSCSHDQVNGVITVHFGSSIVDKMQTTVHSPRGAKKPSRFPASDRRMCGKHTLLSSINGVPYEEYTGLNLYYYGWHHCASGVIDNNLIDVTIWDGLWNDNKRYSYRVAKHYHLVASNPRLVGGSISYTGFVETGSFPSDLKPEEFASAPCSFSSKEDLSVAGSLVNTGSASDDLSYALNVMAIEGFKDAIVMQYVKGTSILEGLSCTSVAMDAVAGIRALDSNSIENAVQATDLTAAIPPLKPVFDVLRDPDDPTTWLKSSSQVYLWWKYSVKPTCSDVRSYIELARASSLKTLQQLKGGSYRSSNHEKIGEWNTLVSAKVTLHPYAADAVSKAVNTLDNVGLLPSLARGWDLVPYSFVADWVTNVGSCLGAIDTTLFESRYQIESVTTGRKVRRDKFLMGTFHLGASLTVSCSGIDYSLYRRVAGSTIPVDPRINLRGLTTTGHTLAGAALLVGNLG